MSFICLGSGAIGSLIGSQLHRAGVRVALVGRGAHLDAIRRRGLYIDVPGDGPPGVFRPARALKVPAFGTVIQAAAAGGPPAVVVLTVKSYDVESAVAELASAALSPPPVVVCLQNGVGSEEIAARFLGPGQVVAGAITLSVDRPSPGRLRLLTNHGGLAMAPHAPAPLSQARPNPSGPSRASATARPLLTTAAWVKTLRAAGFRLRLYERGQAVKWSKLLLNLWANASSAIFDRPPQQVVSEPGLFHMDYLAFREALRVMAAHGIPAVDLPGYPVRLLAALGRALPEGLFRRLLGKRVAGGRGGKMPSLWLDLRSGRGRSEVGYLNGAVVEAGRRVGIPTPANRVLVTTLEDLILGH